MRVQLWWLSPTDSNDKCEQDTSYCIGDAGMEIEDSLLGSHKLNNCVLELTNVGEAFQRHLIFAVQQYR